MRQVIKAGVLAWIALVLVGTSSEILAATPFRPADPGFVVAVLPGGASRPRDRFAGQLAESRLDADVAARLAGELLEQARTTLQPQLYGRAEKVLAPWVERPDAPAALLLLQADILQQRHEFQQSVQLLDRVIVKDSRMVRARLMRANTNIVTGQFERARTDCAWLLGSGDSWTGTVCLTEVLGATGQLDRARILLDRLLANDASTSSREVFAWTLEVRADLAVRSGSLHDAERCLTRAVALTPSSDYLRLALADVLVEEGHAHEATIYLNTARPSVGALLRQTEVLGASPHSREYQESLAALRERLAVSTQRGERTHLREEARLALDLFKDPAAALALALDNFSVQKETEDIRILARAAIATRNRAALDQLQQWIQHTGYRDVVVDQLLQSRRPS
jgi:tetratricopeptide (TPR) repeat protein